jgi:CubicO group peptidase (beta-lactamase class C family)
MRADDAHVTPGCQYERTSRGTGDVAVVTTASVEAVVGRADQLVGDVLGRMPVPGLGAGIVHGGELVWARGFGAADLAAGRPVDVDTVFRIGSISKTMVAIAILQLRDRGLLDLDDALERHLRSWRIEPADGSRPVTIRDLLTHTSGIGELRAVSDLWRPGGRLKWHPRKGPAPDLPNFYGHGFRADVPAGAKWAYANHAFGTLGHLVEEIDGRPFARYMIEEVFDPLGMAGTDFQRTSRIEDRLATGYKLPKRRAASPVDYHEIVIPGAGSVFSSVREMGRYVAAILGGGANGHGRALKETSFAELLRPQWTLDERLSFQQGLSFMLDDYDGHRVVHHGGGWHGFISFMIAAPADDVGVVAFTNSGSAVSYEVADTLMRELLEVADPRDVVPVPGVRAPAEVWPDLVGAYGPAPGLLTNFRTHATFGGQVDVVIRDGHLALRGLAGSLAKPVRLHPLHGDPLRYRALVDEGQRQVPLDVAFVRSDDGTVDGLNLQMLLPMQLRRRPPRKDLRRWLRLSAAGSALAAGGAIARRVRR